MKDFLDRDKAALAVAVCDQIEAALQDGDVAMIEQYLHYIQAWAAGVDTADMISMIQCVRARALEILREECQGK